MRWSRFSLSWFEKNNCRKNSVNVKKYYFFNRDLKLMLCALGKKCMTVQKKKKLHVPVFCYLKIK